MALFIGRIPREMNNRDLEDTFSKYGKITRLDVKKGFGFVEYDDKRDAEDAIKGINEQGDLVVEWAKNGGKRPGENECFHCGAEGHWARDCQEGGRDGGRGGGRGGGGRGGYSSGGRDRSPRRDGGRGSDRDRRDTRDFDRRRDDRGGRDRSPRRNDFRESRGYDGRGDSRGGDRRDGDRRDGRGDRREYAPREDRRRDDDRMPMPDRMSDRMPERMPEPYA
ncbi:uncharacterized protein EV154DRAFT_180145 [Mucor mucedo]|uniref:uncharacterized protein n=1 Tax=Mucor mucedo TaxID=29922 RepID=UPI00221FB096|nr:uncharacterized protein EV154DRAFT_180145 [Mucor mucedo]KAI7892849.1 hypothetical protein EV154DRAFT_180145 [Mucor mucedo]